MAFGGSGFSFGGNNNNNNNNTTSGFGGFGSSANTNTGFGASTTNTGFGASTTASNPFGGGTSTFGSNTGGFGASNNNAGGSSLFGGNKSTASPFGGSTLGGSGGLFGSNNNNNTSAATPFGSGGFGNNASTNTGGFGSNNNSGGGFAFGNNNANKPAFGSASTTTTPLFGQGGAGTTGGFGSGTTGAFGSAGSGTALNQPVPPCEGTASTPFSPTNDKEANGTTNSYQSITFQQPYQKYSFEELRLADYNAGRQYGNGSGQAGAFGASSFGGFGNTNTGTGTGFGGGTTNTNPFGGAATTSAGGFGSNTATSGFGGGTTGLFGSANKPAGGLFGATASTPSTTGGLFGNTANTNPTGGFGTGTGTSTGFGSTNNASGGLFGNQNKPGGLFGSTNASNTNTGGGFSFGGNTAQPSTNTGGGLFGNNNNNTTTGTTGGLFGSNNNNNNAAATGGLFGNNNSAQNKPGGLFGGTSGFGTAASQAPASGGLFGNTNNTNTGGGLFGNASSNNTTTTNNTGGGLFGNTSNTGGGLFGNANNTTNTNTGASLFGNNSNQAKAGGLFGTTSTGGSLFGNNNNNATATNNNTSTGLFGTPANNNSGGLFGNAGANKPTGSLFGNTSTNQQSGGLFGSTNNGGGLFGNSQINQQNNQQQEQFKQSSLLDPNPYGQSSIWTGLPTPTPDNTKPVFTPLTATQKMKESQMKPPPSLRLNQSRYMTPPRRNGFGFSYSNYGTPNSAASTPGGATLSGSMYGSRGWSGGSFGRSFSKSASVQNLRAQYSSDSDDIWKPNAFSSSHRNSSGSIKRLTIDRTIRNDLFTRPLQSALPAPEKPSTANTAGPSAQTNGDTQPDVSNKLKKRVSFDSNATTNSQLNGQTGALVRTESDDDEPVQDKAPESRANGSNGQSTRNNELAVVPEDRESNHVSSRPAASVQSKSDPKPGDYWMRPSRAEISKLPREKLQNFKDFQVGRSGCGQVTFNGLVDLTSLPMDELYDKIIEIRLRSVTVYPDASMKPPVGKGLNVPSTIAIENSWPRSRNQPSSATSGPVFDKHIERLHKIPGTEFVDYEVSTGVWTFRVPHYTRYGLDYDEDEDEDMSELTPPPDTIEKSAMQQSVMEVDADDDENFHEEDDDTFAFKQKTIPGQFGNQPVIDYEPKAPTSPSDDDEIDDMSEQSAYSEEEMSEEEPSIVGSYPAPTLNFDSPRRPIIKAPGTPGRVLLDLEGDWADQLQRTISPRKQNRETLRDAQSKVLLDRVYSPIKPKAPPNNEVFRTSVDVMSSLFGKHEEGRRARKQGKDGIDFEFPYAKRAKTFDPDLQDMSETDKEWHHSFPATFSRTGGLIVKKNSAEKDDEILLEQDGQAIVESKLVENSEPFQLSSLLLSSEVVSLDDVPAIRHQKLPFSYLADHFNKQSSSTLALTSDLYTLAHILFDIYEDKYTSHLDHLRASERESLDPNILHDRFSDFLSAYISRKYSEKISTVEEENHTAAALLKLTCHDIKGACDSLDKAGNNRLMIMVSQLQHAGRGWQDEIRAQIDAWREQSLLSEMTDDIRALYEVCAGNVSICLGKSAANVPVEDRAKTFGISEEFGLDWLQCFALGFWYGREEKNDIRGRTGVVTVESAVRQFTGRCDRGEENEKPRDDPFWVLLRLFATLRGSEGVSTPVFPQALDQLAAKWDASPAFVLHHAIASSVEGAKIDDDKADELASLLAWQSSSRGDLVGAVTALLHLQHADQREEAIQSLLERFAGSIYESSSMTSAATNHTDTTPSNQPESTSSLWTTLTSQLKIPTTYLYKALAQYARTVLLDPHQELNYLILAQSWDAAHECLIHCVAPSLIIDQDYTVLDHVVSSFGPDAPTKVQGWIVGGGVYADFVSLTKSHGKAKDEGLVDAVRGRVVEMGRQFEKTKDVRLGSLSLEELEERVAVKEMAGVLVDMLGDRSEILGLPVTSDRKLSHTVGIAGDYYRGVMAGLKV